ncbi:hypothetical protein H2198_006478 [Neophaeococcomyces mojaviensis]|uniref:Uncharacterized protein n=1 Tax=Neophaeococcomyces mojaviensis TaxID=3383035 RepID=A0ACC3A364_9EURO|nr:hypothetical protein H2198_006478 [Knufia sp. JES_112]
MDSEIVFNADGRPMRRVKKIKAQEQESEPLQEEGMLKELSSRQRLALVSRNSTRLKSLQEEAETLRQLQAEAAAIERENARRECPVPKPKGMLGRLLGLETGVKNIERE